MPRLTYNYSCAGHGPLSSNSLLGSHKLEIADIKRHLSNNWNQRTAAHLSNFGKVTASSPCRYSDSQPSRSEVQESVPRANAPCANAPCANVPRAPDRPTSSHSCRWLDIRCCESLVVIILGPEWPLGPDKSKSVTAYLSWTHCGVAAVGS